MFVYCGVFIVYYSLFNATIKIFMEVECGVGLWGFKDPFSLELHCAKCNNVVLCNVLFIGKSLVMVFDLSFIV